MCAWAQKTADEYADLFNEHLNAGLQSSITMTVDLPLYAVNTQVFTLTDTVTGGPAGYVYNGYMITDSAQVDSATMILKEGIRLEMAMKQSKKNKNMWLWTGDEQVPDSIDYMYERVQEDFARFWTADDLERTEHVAQMAVKYYPTRAEYWNNMGAVAMWKNDKKKAMKYFQKALKLNPNDELIKANIEYIKSL